MSTLVFLHEGLGSAELWRDIPGRFAQTCGSRTLVYSRRGNGHAPVMREPRKVSYMHDEAGLLEDLLEARGIADAILVGHSDGASIAVIHCGMYSGRVRGAVLLAPHVFVEAHSLRGIARAKRSYETTGLRKKLARWHDDPDATFYGWNDIWLAPEFERWNIRTFAREIRIPVLAVQGADDEYGTFAQITALLEDVQGRADALHLASCGHNPLRDRPDCFGAIAAWILRASD